MRTWIFALATLVAGIVPSAASNLDAKFLIERKGKVIGYHMVDVEETDFGTRVDTRIEMKVGLGPVTLFRYDHEATEIWRGDDVISIVSKTDNNGKKSFVDAKRYQNALMIEGAEYKGAAPEGAVPSSYWNKDIVAAEALINTETGEIIDVETAKIGETRAPNDQSAHQYRVTGTVALNLWYDGERWVGSNFTIDGEELTYVLVNDEREFAALERFLN
ncbi:MAG: DUF6134 family protein [Pseudomonadota bacterium]